MIEINSRKEKMKGTDKQKPTKKISISTNIDSKAFKEKLLTKHLDLIQNKIPHKLCNNRN